ncbi:hypothetical protein [Streptomyces sp. HUAS ZL42]|uniref:hypothetical protein n=1 Tax=Streptomyces sp. HUAS ZL42 TaxID=3231715 RepID=UPI00345EF80C
MAEPPEVRRAGSSRLEVGVLVQAGRGLSRDQAAQPGPHRRQARWELGPSWPAMVASRWFGRAMIGRFGRVSTVNVLSMVSFTGVTGSAAGIDRPRALAGARLRIAGAFLRFPAGLSAAHDRGVAEARVSDCSSIAWSSWPGRQSPCSSATS